MRNAERAVRSYNIVVDVSSLLSGYSKGLYASWLRYKPDNLLVDCGEGCATALGNESFAIERVLLTHGHIDHIAGLPVLLWARAAGMGDNEKPLAIFYPQDDLYLADMIQFLERTRAKVPFDLTWTPLAAGDSFPLTNSEKTTTHARRIETFATRHIPHRLTIGYKICETRRRLRIEYSNLDQNELRDLRKNTVEISENYDAIVAAFGGDGLPLNADDVRGAELLVHEATILDAAERKQQWHSTLAEALEVAAQAQPKAFVLQHFSGRYRTEEIKRAAQSEIARLEIEFPVWCLFRDRLWQINPQNPERQ